MKTIDLLKESKVSYFGNCTYTRPYKDITLLDWLTFYTKINRDKVFSIRRAAASGDDDKKKLLKEDLAAVTISGTFNTRAVLDLNEPTYILCVDIDHVDDVEKVKQDCFKIKGVFFSSLSCSGTGIYCMLKYKAGLDHKKVYNAVKSDFKSIGYDIDKCSDIDRLRYCSYDYNMLLSEDYEEYDREEEDVVIYNMDDEEAYIDGEFAVAAIYCLVDHCNYKANDYYDWLNDGFRIASIRSYPFSELAFLHISENSPGFKSKEDVHKKWIECCNKTTRKSSSISYYYAKLKQKYGQYWIDVVNEYKKELVQ